MSDANADVINRINGTVFVAGADMIMMKIG